MCHFVESSFTIEFPEHVADEKKQYCLTRLEESGASVEQQSSRIFQVICRKPNELARAGWTLFHTHLRNACQIVGTSGMAEDRATAFPNPSKT